MEKRTGVSQEKPEEEPKDALTEGLRQGASKMLAQAIKAEVETILGEHSGLRDEAGSQQDPERILAGAGDSNRAGRGRRQGPTGGGSQRLAHSVFIEHPAALSEVHQKRGGVAALNVPEGSHQPGLQTTC